MLLPSIFGENLFDDMMNFDFGYKHDFSEGSNIDFDKEFERMGRPLYGKHAQNMMKTDVRESEKSYELDIDLPGFSKDEITVQLENGYLSISAAKGLDKDQENKDGKYIRRERYAGSMSRTFYVGDQLTEQDIQAKFENGILQLTVPKKEAKQVEGHKYIAIE